MELARCGARVICADVNETGGQALVDGSAPRPSSKVECVPIDLAASPVGRAAARPTCSRAIRASTSWSTPPGWGDIQPYMQNDARLHGQGDRHQLGRFVHLTQALLPLDDRRRSGRIVNIASDAGRVGSGGETVYAAAKGGVIAFTKSLAREVARQTISVNCVCPGPTDTPMLATRSEKLREPSSRRSRSAASRKPEEIADAIVFFAGPRSSYVTGQVLSVSGGLTFAG